jgi:hypothetical protein
MKNRDYAHGKNVIELVLSSDAAVYETWTSNSFTPIVVQNMNWPPAVRKCFGGLWLLAVFPPKVLYICIWRLRMYEHVNVLVFEQLYLWT